MRYEQGFYVPEDGILHRMVKFHVGLNVQKMMDFIRGR
jgi:hypothetical protein